MPILKGGGAPMYQFLLNMWIMDRLDEAYLANQVAKGRITVDEMELITATPQYK